MRAISGVAGASGIEQPAPLCGGTVDVPWGDRVVTFHHGLRTHPGETIVALGEEPVVSGVALGEGALIYVGGHVAQDLEGPAPDGNVAFVRRLLELCDVRPTVHTDRRDVHAVLQAGDREAYLFVLNTGHRARAVTVRFEGEAPSVLADADDDATVEVSDGEAEVFVDCKRARIFRVQ